MTSSEDSPARRLRDALEPVAALSFYPAPVLEAFASLGLAEFRPAYVWSRSSVLGVANAAVVTSAFGVWEPGLIQDSLQVARAASSLSEIRDATVSGAGAAAREVLSDVDVADVRRVGGVLRRGVDHADLAGRPLFAGNRSWPWPDDPHEALWRVATAWRELRGDSHLAACVVAGISGVQANILTELEVGYPLGEYTATRNWSADVIQAAAAALSERGLVDHDDLTDDGRALRRQIEAWTDTAVEPAVAAVGSELDDVVDLANAWSQLIIDRGWFPDDEKKRAAG